MDPAARPTRESPVRSPYRGRLAPSPTGLLHLGHARTFWTAYQRARSAQGTLILRNEDLDRDRARPEFVAAFIEDLHWFGIQWDEGPDLGGPHAPYDQSRRIPAYRDAFERLRRSGHLFPCTCSRRDIQSALAAPHAADEEPVYPGTCRSRDPATIPAGTRVSWRFRVPDGLPVSFLDQGAGPQCFTAGADFGDFILWRHDDLPSYQLACVVDDAAMGITEVVRGADLLVSTARQLLIYQALGLTPPAFHHCPLVTDAAGVRLAKRHDALSLRSLRESGRSPDELRGT
ncbi:MAG: tRNA glutamyl-Q(34) synthetase GluQRS [Verrucomicrobiales bacterium]|nr:tRNA glutamyl-Q(34) synthetase GluQRS [Verrucomicrobiales bacterium]